MNPKAKLILVPTPIDSESPLEPVAWQLLSKAGDKDIICVEEARTGRRRWLHYGLPREQIDHFTLYNEHNRHEQKLELIKKIKNNHRIFLMSDCGLPAFCDPGAELVDLCHQNMITVSSTPFANSTLLAIALSGFQMDQFSFRGFLPQKSEMRQLKIKEIFKDLKKTGQAQVLMETPYRYKRLREEFIEINNSFLELGVKGALQLFLGFNLNCTNELLYRGCPSQAPKDLKSPFVAIIRVDPLLN